MMHQSQNEVKQLQIDKGGMQIKMELTTGLTKALSVKLLYPIAFETYEQKFDAAYLKEKNYLTWFETPEELFEYFRVESDSIEITPKLELTFQMDINKTLGKKKDFVFAFQQQKGQVKKLIDNNQHLTKQIDALRLREKLNFLLPSPESNSFDVTTTTNNNGGVIANIKNSKDSEKSAIYICRNPVDQSLTYKFKVIKLPHQRCSIGVYIPSNPKKTGHRCFKTILDFDSRRVIKKLRNISGQHYQGPEENETYIRDEEKIEFGTMSPEIIFNFIIDWDKFKATITMNDKVISEVKPPKWMKKREFFAAIKLDEDEFELELSMD